LETFSNRSQLLRPAPNDFLPTNCGFAFIILPLPSALTALSGYRNLTLFALGAGLIAGALALFTAPRIAPLLQRWRYSYWIGTFAADVHRVPCSDHWLQSSSAPQT
jgi:hypothetical protein